MNRDQLRQIIGDAVGNPAAGTVAQHLDTIADALNEALNPPGPQPEKRVITPDETR